MSTFGNESTKDQAASEASDLKRTVSDEASTLASTVGSESQNVMSEAKYQAKGLVDESVGQLRSQAATGQQRLAEVVREFAGEAGTMAEGSGQSGIATKLASDAARVGDDLAGWLEGHGPDDVLREVRRFAARRPGTFLAIAAGAGLLAGRFLRGVRDEGADDTRALTTGYSYQDPRRAVGEHAYSYSEDTGRLGTTGGSAYPVDPAYPLEDTYAADTEYQTSGGYQTSAGYPATPGYQAGSDYETTTGQQGYQNEPPR